jgi:GNAT superfamily N-acetyltransferase
MNEDEFESLKQHSLSSFAVGKVAAGYLNEVQARAIAEQTLAQLLPQGVETPGQHLVAIEERASGERVGLLWFGIADQGAGPLTYLFDGLIYEAHRRRGLAAATLEAIESASRQAGASQVALQLFGGNEAARSLFEGRGFQVTDVMLSKSL